MKRRSRAADEPLPRLVSAAQIMAIYQITPPKLRQLLASGVLPQPSCDLGPRSRRWNLAELPGVMPRAD